MNEEGNSVLKLGVMYTMVVSLPRGSMLILATLAARVTCHTYVCHMSHIYVSHVKPAQVASILHVVHVRAAHSSGKLRRASHITRHTSPVKGHTSHVTRHPSKVTRHTSHVTRHLHRRRTLYRPRPSASSTRHNHVRPKHKLHMNQIRIMKFES